MLRYVSLTFALTGLCLAQGKWLEQKNPFTDSSITYRGVSFVDSLTGYVFGLGDIGYEVVKTTDGGKSWEVLKQPNYKFNSPANMLTVMWGRINFIDSLTGWVVTNNGTINSTVDGGKTWDYYIVNPSAPPILNDVEFVNKKKGWIVGYGWAGGMEGRSIILHTEDGGKNWFYQDSLTHPFSPNAVTFLDTLKGFAVGDTGLILRTLDGGKHWDSTPSGTTNSLYDIQFADSLHGIVGGYGGTVLKTADGGGSWAIVPSIITGQMFDIAYPDTNHAWGASYYMWFSPDGGSNWLKETNPTYEDMNAVSFSDTAHGWAVGTYGHIIHYTLSTGVDEKKKDSQIIRNSLEVSPNPFRQTEAISYQIASQSAVAIKIYDAKGGIIKSLVNESKTPGKFKNYWDGTNDYQQRVPDGIYFCRLEVNGQSVDQKKIILVH